MGRGPTREVPIRASDFDRIEKALELYSRVYPERKGYQNLLAQWRHMR